MTQISLEIIKLLKIFTWLIMDNRRLKLFLRVFFVYFQILHGLHSHGGLSYFTPILRIYCFPLSNSSSLLIVSFLLPLQFPLFTINHHYKALQCNTTSMEKLMASMRGQISPYITNNLKLYFRSFSCPATEISNAWFISYCAPILSPCLLSLSPPISSLFFPSLLICSTNSKNQIYLIFSCKKTKPFFFWSELLSSISYLLSQVLIADLF